jgi:hypothetical protein
MKKFFYIKYVNYLHACIFYSLTVLYCPALSVPRFMKSRKERKKEAHIYDLPIPGSPRYLHQPTHMPASLLLVPPNKPQHTKTSTTISNPSITSQAWKLS